MEGLGCRKPTLPSELLSASASRSQGLRAQRPVNRQPLVLGILLRGCDPHLSGDSITPKPVESHDPFAARQGERRPPTLTVTPKEKPRKTLCWAWPLAWATCSASETEKATQHRLRTPSKKTCGVVAFNFRTSGCHTRHLQYSNCCLSLQLIVVHSCNPPATPCNPPTATTCNPGCSRTPYNAPECPTNSRRTAEEFPRTHGELAMSTPKNSRSLPRTPDHSQALPRTPRHSQAPPRNTRLKQMVVDSFCCLVNNFFTFPEFPRTPGNPNWEFWERQPTTLTGVTP